MQLQRDADAPLSACFNDSNAFPASFTAQHKCIELQSLLSVSYIAHAEESEIMLLHSL